MNWISVKESLPDCHYKQGHSLISDYVVTLNIKGEYCINRYWVHTNLRKDCRNPREQWQEYDTEITHWCLLTKPDYEMLICV